MPLLTVLLLCACLGYAEAQFTQQPTFAYTFNPPFQWTFNPNVTGIWPRQYLTAADAQNQMQSDVSASFQQAMRTAGYSLFLGSLQYTVTGYTPTTNVTINQQNVANTYVPEVGAVTGFRPTITSIQPYVQSQTLRVTQSSLLLPLSQWQVVASYFYNAMNLQHNVHFVTQIVVS